MTRITLSLPEDFASALRREARRRHTSVSAVAREAFAERFGLTSAKREVPFAAIVSNSDGRTAAEAEQMLDEIAEEVDRDAFGGRDR